MPKWDAYRLHMAQTGVLSLAGTLIWTAMLVYQVQVVGLNPLQLVLVGTVMELTIFLCEIPTGVLADVYSRRLSYVMGILLMGLAYVIQGFLPIFEAILLAQVVWGLGHTFTSGAYDAWLVDELGQERVGTAFLRGGQVARVVGILGIVLSGVIGSVDIRLPILLGAAMFVLTAVGLWVVMPENHFTPTPREDRNTFQVMTHTFMAGVREVRQRPVLIRILAIGLFFGLYSEAWDRLWQTHLINSVGLPTFIILPTMVWFSGLYLLETLVGLLSSEVLQRRLDMTDNRRLVQVLMGLTSVMIVSLVAYGLTQNFIVAIVAFVVFTVARSLVSPLYSTWSNQNIDSSVRATVLSMQGQVDAIGEMAGGPPLGAIGQRALPLAFIGSALVLSPVLGLLRGAGMMRTVMDTPADDAQ